MDATAMSTEIQQVRDRLGEIEDARKRLADDAFAEKVDLLDEEHQLQARLGELRDAASEAGAGFAEHKASAQTDITRTPSLPAH